MYERWLTDRDRIRTEVFKKRNKVIGFFIAYEAKIDGKWYSIIHYDTYHEFPHKDVIRPDGTKQKERLPDIGLKNLVKITRKDLEENWLKYRKRFERWLYG